MKELVEFVARSLVEQPKQVEVQEYDTDDSAENALCLKLVNSN